MGILRLVLALVVLVSHFPYIKIDTFISGALAVRVFYLLSGFYIQYIILQYSSQENWRPKFYLSRLLRIFPTYYLMLFLTIWFAGTTCNRQCVSMVINGSYSSLLYYYISNFLIVGQSIGKFLVYHFSTGRFSFDPHAYNSNYWVSSAQILSQGWSIDMELLFYLFAPFILRRQTRDLIFLGIVSLIIRLTLTSLGYSNPNNWFNSFFPSEMHTFILGALACRIAASKIALTYLQKYLVSLGIIFILAFGLVQDNPYILDKGELLIMGIFCLLPFIFMSTCKSRIDRWVGDLSYPVYLNHLLVIAFCGQYIKDPAWWLFASIVTSITISVLVVEFIEHPITQFRHRKFKASHITLTSEAIHALDSLGRWRPILSFQFQEA